jgi:hypothetical protein
LAAVDLEVVGERVTWWTGWALVAWGMRRAIFRGSQPREPVAVGRTESCDRKTACRVLAGVPIECHSLTARDALEQALAAQPSDRLHRFETICGPRGVCRREPLTNDPGRWTWCPDCRTVFDDYGTPVNPIPEYIKAH